ncbi:hypothetical protein P7C70_g742, partial [Phenoliferia sp. Uapishka_3]
MPGETNRASRSREPVRTTTAFDFHTLLNPRPDPLAHATTRISTNRERTQQGPIRTESPTQLELDEEHDEISLRLSSRPLRADLTDPASESDSTRTALEEHLRLRTYDDTYYSDPSEDDVDMDLLEILAEGGESESQEEEEEFQALRTARPARSASAPRRTSGGSFSHALREMMLSGDAGEAAEDDDSDDSQADGSHSLSAFWPGLIGTQPLNAPSPLRHSALPPSPTEPETPKAPTFSRFDPPSATSPTSFLRPGAVLNGQQIFSKRTPKPSGTGATRNPFILPPGRPPGVPPTSSLLGFTSPPPLYPADLPSSSRPRTPLEDYQAAEARLDPQRRLPPPVGSTTESQTAHSLARHSLDLATASLSSTLPSSLSSLSSSSRAARARSLRDAVDAVRTRVEARHRADFLAESTTVSAYEFIEEGVRNSARTSAVDQVRRELDERVSRDDSLGLEGLREQVAILARRAALYGNPETTTTWPEESAETEHWAVRVVIHTYTPEKKTISGLMHALGVPHSTTQVTTYFIGDIIDPAVDGLYTRKWNARRKDDIEYWTKLGPFKNVSKDELAERANDPLWLREQTDGWLLMRWKEADFVNVTKEDSTLSISGFYLIAMQRSTGALEGLYCDHSSSPYGSPYQRLILSAATPRAPFTLGTFGVL